MLITAAREPREGETPMRTIMSFGIATMLVLVAVGTWTVTTSGSQIQPELTGVNIMPLELMMNVKELPAQQYDAI